MINQIKDQKNKVIYQDKNISIFESKIIFQGEAFLSNEITNVKTKIVKSNHYIPWLIIAVGIISVSIGYSTSNFDLLYFGFAPISAGITWLIWLVKKKHIIIIETKNGQVETVTTKDNKYAQLIIDLINRKVDQFSESRDIMKIFLQDELVTVTDQSFNFDSKVFSIDIIDQSKAEINPARKKLSIYLILLGVIIFIYYGTQSRSDLETYFGMLVTAIGLFLWFKKQYTVSLTLINNSTINSIISKDLKYCQSVDNAIQEAMNANQKVNV